MKTDYMYDIGGCTETLLIRYTLHKRRMQGEWRHSSLQALFAIALDRVSRANAVAQASVVRPSVKQRTFSLQEASELMPYFVERQLTATSPDNVDFLICFQNRWVLTINIDLVFHFCWPEAL